MFPLEIYFSLTLILFIITIPFYISKIREYNPRKSQYIILILLLIMCSIFFSNLGSFIPSDIENPFETAIFSGFSYLLLFFSVFVFIKSFFPSDQDIIELKPPSRYRARKGLIELGKVMKKERNTNSFSPLKILKDICSYVVLRALGRVISYNIS